MSTDKLATIAIGQGALCCHTLHKRTMQASESQWAGGALKQFPAGQQAASNTSGQLGAAAKIMPRLPPPPPPGPPAPPNGTMVSACSGYLTKEEIMAGLKYAAGQEYLPFDPG